MLLGGVKEPGTAYEPDEFGLLQPTRSSGRICSLPRSNISTQQASCPRRPNHHTTTGSKCNSCLTGVDGPPRKCDSGRLSAQDRGLVASLRPPTVGARPNYVSAKPTAVASSNPVSRKASTSAGQAYAEAAAASPSTSEGMVANELDSCDAQNLTYRGHIEKISETSVQCVNVGDKEPGNFLGYHFTFSIASDKGYGTLDRCGDASELQRCFAGSAGGPYSVITHHE